MLDRILRVLTRWAVDHSGIVLSVAGVLCVISIVYASLELRMNADTDDLIATDRPFKDEYDAFIEEFGDLEFLYVVVETDADIERTQACVDFLAARLRAIDLLPGVFWSIEPEEQLRLATRAMNTEALQGLAVSSSAFGLLRDADDVRQLITHAERLLAHLQREGGTMSASERERLGAAGVFLARVIGAAADVSEQPRYPGEGLSREYLQSASGALHFITIMPEKDYGTMAVIAEPLRLIREAIDEARAAFPGMEIGLTGKPVLQADEMSTTERDMTRASIMAIAVISIMFMLIIGGIWRPVLAVVALLGGMAWTFGLTTLVVGQLNLLSIVFTLVLVGVGIDFGIHIIARYKERLRLEPPRDAIVNTIATAGRGNVTGAVTSSMAFFMAIFTDFQGLRELGFIAGTGLLLCLTSMTIVLPALLTVYERAWGHGRISPLLSHAIPQRGEAIWSGLIRRPGLVLTCCAVASLAMVPMMTRLGFQENLLELQARGLESVEWEHRILDDSAETWFGAVIVDEIDEIHDVTRRALERPTVATVRSVFDIVQPGTPERDAARERLHADPIPVDDAPPPPADSIEAGVGRLAGQVESLARMAGLVSTEHAVELRALTVDLRRLARRLADPADIDAAVQEMEQHRLAAAAGVGTMLAGDLMSLRDALPRLVRDRYVSAQGRYLVTLHPRENVWQFEPMKAFVADMREVDPDATGVPITQFESLIEMKHAFLKAAILAFIAVFILLLLDLRSVRYTLFAIIPLCVGMLWTVQLMAVFGVRFNLANFFAVPILIGIGVDSGIHMIRRFREDGGDEASHVASALNLGSTRRAVFVTAMTSMIGFGSLMTASHRGLNSLGQVMALGSIACLLASLVVLPALLAWRIRR